MTGPVLSLSKAGRIRQLRDYISAAAAVLREADFCDHDRQAADRALRALAGAPLEPPLSKERR